jgi:hypothetical protein
MDTSLFDLLQGTWIGTGRGEFPGVSSFDFRGTLVFTRRDVKSIAYNQRIQKRYDGQTEWLESHWESGFIRVLDSGELELTSAQIGRVEVLTGKVDGQDSMIQVHFVSKAIANDPRVVSSRRRFELEGDALRYKMEMHTTKVSQSTPHVKITLQRAKESSEL